MEYTIGEFSNASGISIHTLRYYEKEQLLKPNRLHNDRRCYSERDLIWMQFVMRLKETGMPIKDIQVYANLRAKGDTTLQQRMDMLAKHRFTLKNKIDLMQKSLAKLDEKIDYYQDEIIKYNPSSKRTEASHKQQQFAS